MICPVCDQDLTAVPVGGCQSSVAPSLRVPFWTNSRCASGSDPRTCQVVRSKASAVWPSPAAGTYSARSHAPSSPRDRPSTPVGPRFRRGVPRRRGCPLPGSRRHGPAGTGAGSAHASPRGRSRPVGSRRRSSGRGCVLIGMRAHIPRSEQAKIEQTPLRDTPPLRCGNRSHIRSFPPFRAMLSPPIGNWSAATMGEVPKALEPKLVNRLGVEPRGTVSEAIHGDERRRNRSKSGSNVTMCS